MNELSHLKSLWRQKIRRSLTIIVDISIEKESGLISNPDWLYNVPYAYREALDISYDERVKNKKKYMVWTQGPILNFKDGDTLISADGREAVQVTEAKPVGWDKSKDEMYEGLIRYTRYETKNGITTQIATYTTTQMGFLGYLIGVASEKRTQK